MNFSFNVRVDRREEWKQILDESYRSILKGLPFYNRAIQSGLPFPKTRRIVFLGDRPATLPGWSVLDVS